MQMCNNIIPRCLNVESAVMIINIIFFAIDAFGNLDRTVQQINTLPEFFEKIFILDLVNNRSFEIALLKAIVHQKKVRKQKKRKLYRQ